LKQNYEEKKFHSIENTHLGRNCSSCLLFDGWPRCCVILHDIAVYRGYTSISSNLEIE